MSRWGGKARSGFVFKRKETRKKEHGVPDSGSRGADQACRDIDPSDWLVGSLTGLAVGPDDVVRAERARAAGPPHPIEVTLKHVDIQVFHDCDARLDLNVSFGQTEDSWREIILPASKSACSALVRAPGPTEATSA